MTTELAKQLGITLEPFGVKTKDLTPQLAQDLLDRVVDLGAIAYEGYEGYCEDEVEYNLERKYEYTEGYYTFDKWEVVGVDLDLDTFLTVADEIISFNHNILTFPEMCDYLQVHQEGDRLVANEDSVDDGGFILWDGRSDVPVPAGAIVQIRLDTGEEDIIVTGGNRMFNLWHRQASGPTIVGYKLPPKPDLDAMVEASVKGLADIADGSDGVSWTGPVDTTTPEVDSDGFTPWNGGEMPVEKGTMVHVKYRNDEESVVTAGLYSTNKGFKREEGVLVAIYWGHSDGSNDRVAYKVVEDTTATPPTPPVSSVERSSVFDSVEVGSNLERALELVLAVYNGDEVSFNQEGYNGNTRVDDIVTYILDVTRVIGSGNNYTLKSEEEANIRSEEKEKLDKEIEELENRLQQCKDEREEMSNE